MILLSGDGCISAYRNALCNVVNTVLSLRMGKILCFVPRGWSYFLF